MSASWARTHRRYQLFDAVLADFGRASGRFATGRIEAGRLAEIEVEFGGLNPFLCYAQRRWHTTVVARFDALAEERPRGLADSVGSTGSVGAARRLWISLGAERGDLRALLDAYAGTPELDDAERRTRRAAAELAGVDPDQLVAAESGSASRHGFSCVVRTALRGIRRRRTAEAA